MDKDYYNASGCSDPTAYKAVRNVQREEAEQKVSRLMKILKAAISENGFVLVNRIELKDKASGVVFK